MKRVCIALILGILGCIAVSAQPRAIGARIGATGFDISYQHTVGKQDFVQAEISTDFGYASSGRPGFKATAIYNIVFARPAWTEKGTWALFAGPGLSMGYVQDRVVYRSENMVYNMRDYGFMLSAVAQAGLEYTFWFPLQISVDLRPYFGFHINDGIKRKVGDMAEQVIFDGKAGYYGNGWFGFIPTLSFRYRF